MNPFSESSLQDPGEGPSFLSLLGLTCVLLTAGIGFAVLLAVA